MLDLFLMTLVWVFVLDISGFIPEVEDMLTKALDSKLRLSIPKPFSCSLCMTFWTGLIYIIITGFSLPLLMYVCTLAFLTPVFGRMMWFLRGLMDRVFETLESIFNIK